MFKIGADPELFFRSGNKLVSVIDKLGGSKSEPLPLAVPGCAIQEDNVAAEYNIPPCDTVEDFVRHNKYVLQELATRAQAMGFQLASKVASHSFDEDQLMHWKASVFGCDPDYNAWTREQNPSPYCEDRNLRSAGGHVHIGSNLNPYELGKACDVFLGVPAIARDSDTRRRSLYGKHGAIRIKPYGVEYRTLSNFWIWDEQDMRWVYDQTKKAVEFVSQGKTVPEEFREYVAGAIDFGRQDCFDVVMEYAHANS